MKPNTTTCFSVACLLLIPSLTGFTVLPQKQTSVLALRASVADNVVEKQTKAQELSKEAQELLDVLVGDKKHDYDLVIAQTAPSVRVAFPEIFGLPPGSLETSIMVASIKALGFDLVLDTNTAADLTVMEEGHELLNKVKAKAANPDAADHMPLFTSCCPGWLAFVEKSAPEFAPYVSSCKSPHMMFGALLKAYSQDMFGVPADRIYVCSVMPCVRKRGESDQVVFARDGIRDVDNVITTKDLGMLMECLEIDLHKLEEAKYDSPFQLNGRGSGAGQLFGATGGVMEAAVRTVYEVVTGHELPRLELDQVRGLDGVKEAILPLQTEDGKGLPIDLRVAVVNGLGEAKKLLKRIKSGEVQYDFVEVMACPGGCIGGGGQPRGGRDIINKRLEAIYDLDRSLPRRMSHDNPTVQRFYQQFLGECGSERAHELLHVKPVYGKLREEEE